MKDNTNNQSEKKINFITWEEAKEKSKKFLSNFSLKEKTNLLYGTSIKTSNRCVG